MQSAMADIVAGIPPTPRRGPAFAADRADTSTRRTSPVTSGTAGGLTFADVDPTCLSKLPENTSRRVARSP